MDVFSKIIDADPYYPLAYELVGTVNEIRGRLGEAIRHYKRVYDLEPRGDTATKLANLFIDIGDFSSADEWIAAAVAHSPDQYRFDLEWLKISALAARGEQDAVRLLLRPMLEVTTPSVAAYLNAASAGYFLAEPQAAIAAWEKAQSIESQGLHLEMGMNLDASIAAAYAYRQTGQSADSDAILLPLESWLDEQMADHVRVDPQLWFVKAKVMAIRGEPNVALIHLQRAVDEGWRQHWRPAVEPCFAELLDLPSFQSMMAGLAVRMDLMREQLAFDASFDAVSVAPASQPQLVAGP